MVTATIRVTKVKNWNKVRDSARSAENFLEIRLKSSTKTWILVGRVTLWVLSKMSCLLSTFCWGGRVKKFASCRLLVGGEGDRTQDRPLLHVWIPLVNTWHSRGIWVDNFQQSGGTLFKESNQSLKPESRKFSSPERNFKNGRQGL